MTTTTNINTKIQGEEKKEEGDKSPKEGEGGGCVWK